jgi:hypothetical protein
MGKVLSSIKVQQWIVGVFLFGFLALSYWGMLWSKSRNEERWSDPLSPKELALHESIVSAIKLGDAGMRFLDSIGHEPGVHEILIRLDTDMRNPLSNQGQTIALKQPGRFSVGRQGNVGGYEYTVKFSRPEAFVLGLSEDRLPDISELGFWLFAGLLVFYLFIGTKAMEDSAMERAEKKAKLRGHLQSDRAV